MVSICPLSRASQKKTEHDLTQRGPGKGGRRPPKPPGDEPRESPISEEDLLVLVAAHGEDLRRQLKRLTIRLLPLAALDGSWIAVEKLIAKTLELDEGLEPEQTRGPAEAQDAAIDAIARLPAPARRAFMKKLTARFKAA